MKYCCKNCGSIIESDKWIPNAFMECPLCNADCRSTLVIIPDYETPEQYEKRTGKAYPSNGLVWWRIRYNDEWCYERNAAIPKTLRHVVIADPPVPPPDDFVSENSL